MKLITLNIWGGHVEKPLLEFIVTHQDIDIFCLQEVYHNAKCKISTEERFVSLDVFSDIQTLLPNHQGFFSPVVDDIYGICIFVSKNIKVVNNERIVIYNNPDYIGRGPTHSRVLQWLHCDLNGKNYVIVNVHGLWNGKGKTDTPDRLEQAKNIRNFIDTVNLPYILCGDFNLRPDTQSINIIGNGMKNLIDLYQIKSTRTSFYEKEEKFADYIFTSQDITVHDFKVLNDEVSDHTPLFLDFV